jgi:hypothetical protein
MQEKSANILADFSYAYFSVQDGSQYHRVAFGGSESRILKRVFRKLSSGGFPGSGNTGKQSKVLKPLALIY